MRTGATFEKMSEALQTALTDVLQGYWVAPLRLARLTGFGWRLKALETIRTL